MSANDKFISRHTRVAGGLGHLQGKVFRFGHMGYCFPSDILEAVSLIEAGLQDFNYSFDSGAGIKAAQDVFLRSKKNDNARS